MVLAMRLTPQHPARQLLIPCGKEEHAWPWVVIVGSTALEVGIKAKASANEIDLPLYQDEYKVTSHLPKAPSPCHVTYPQSL